MDRGDSTADVRQGSKRAAASGEVRVGRVMVQKLQRKLSANRRPRILLEVRESNLHAQKFFRSMGFRAINVLPDFYEDTDEAAYLFEYRVPV